MKYSEWNIPSLPAEVPRELLDAGFTPLLAAILALRGMTTAQAAREFLYGGQELLENPLLLTDMPLAVWRITRAIQNHEKMAVYGDYDVDGITSACLLTEYLRSLDQECELYIPDRMEEGYGLNVAAISALHDRGVTLIITVDCGVTAIEETEFAASIGVDMVITDHHECRESLPDAVAVVDPKRPDCNYPTRNLAGVGVAFKLVCAMDGSSRRMLDRFSDLVAVGTVADVMPMVGENRFMIKAGMEKLQRSPRPGLRALMVESGVMDKKLTAMTIGFSLAPRINAAGRLGQAPIAARLLMTHNPQEGRELADTLCSLNRERQELESGIWTQAVEILEKDPPTTPIVLASDHWHPGVIGIAASRLTEAYSLPTVMICLDGDRGKGSCRSYGDFNLFDALAACSEHLESFGGHAMAAGLNITRENIPAFKEALGEYYKHHIPKHVPQLDVDMCITDPDLLSMECVESLTLLEPCGNGNPRPLFCVEGAVLESIIPIGSGKHLRLRLGKFGNIYECVFFSMTQENLGASVGDRVDAAFYPQINEFRGRRSVQLLMTDLRRAAL